MLKNELIKSLADRDFDSRIIKAFQKVERKDFVPENLEESAYEDRALPIGCGQTISQPFTIAFMLRALEVRPGQKIMEVGSGSGYVLALLSELTGKSEIYGVERVKELVERSRAVLKEHDNIKVFSAGKSLGLPENAPFDRILVSAAASRLPEELLEQLSEGGILVCPVENDIVKAKKEKGKISKTSYYGFAFVPLIK